MTYLLRVINVALFSQVYFKIASRNFTVVAADANYVNPYTTDVISIIAPDAPSESYSIVVVAQQMPKPKQQLPYFVTTGTLPHKQNESGHGNAE
nr:unnamed protein product [Digitaria exilis]CAB3505024.1 unnamed protein product [Digitaria exilis]